MASGSRPVAALRTLRRARLLFRSEPLLLHLGCCLRAACVAIPSTSVFFFPVCVLRVWLYRGQSGFPF
eukprot:5418555-Pyramimonas_sp.AAC.1